MTPSERMQRGMLDALRDKNPEDSLSSGRTPELSPKLAHSVCLTCLRAYPSLQGVWNIRACCVYCEHIFGYQNDIKYLPHFQVYPDRSYSQDAMYMYGFLTGAALSFGEPIQLGGFYEPYRPR